MPSYAKYTGISGGGGGGGGTGTVTSVALADGSSTPIYTVTGSPVTTSGTLTETLKTQIANKVFAGPTTGSAAQPTFRALVSADLPFSVGDLSDVGTDGITVTGGSGSVIGSGTSIAQHVADATHNGYLSSGDWSTFNGKQSALTIGNLTDAGTDGITVTGGTGAIIGSGTSIAQHVADASHNGYLASGDWTTFNNKQASLSVTAPTLDTSQLYNNFGTCTGQGMIYSIVGGKLHAQFHGVTGTLVAGTFSITLPASKTVNTALYSSGQFVVGQFFRYTSGGTTNNATPNGPWPIFYDSANAIITIALNYGSGTNLFVSNTAPSAFIGAGGAFWGSFTIFIN